MQERNARAVNIDDSFWSPRAPESKGTRRKSRDHGGPLVYCLESLDNLNLDIFTPQLDPASVRDEFVSDLLGGTCGHLRQKHCQQATEIPSILPLGQPG